MNKKSLQKLFQYNKEEIALLSNQQLIQEKRQALKKINEQLIHLGEETRKQINGFKASKSPKVSKGENLEGYPFRVLDYPRIFSKSDIFAFRTLFWWGNFVSFTLHLKGKYLSLNFDKLKFLALEHPTPLFLSTSGNEWNHNPTKENYITLNAENLAKYKTEKLSFLKIVQLEPIENLNKISESYKLFLNQLIVPLCNDRI